MNMRKYVFSFWQSYLNFPKVYKYCFSIVMEDLNTSNPLASQVGIYETQSVILIFYIRNINSIDICVEGGKGK